MQLFCWISMLNCWNLGRSEGIQEEDYIDVVHDEPLVPPSAFEVEKAIEVVQQFTLFCDKGDDLREVLSEVNMYSQRAIAKSKKQKTIKDYFKLWLFEMMCFCITYYA